MTNQGESKNRNHINTGVSFKFIHYMADLLGWDYIMLYYVSLTNKRRSKARHKSSASSDE